MKGSYLGPNYTDKQIEKELIACGARYKKLSQLELVNEVALELSKGKAVGWMQGRMEFGPRALGQEA